MGGTCLPRCGAGTAPMPQEVLQEPLPYKKLSDSADKNEIILATRFSLPTAT